MTAHRECRSTNRVTTVRAMRPTDRAGIWGVIRVRGRPSTSPTKTAAMCGAAGACSTAGPARRVRETSKIRIRVRMRCSRQDRTGRRSISTEQICLRYSTLSRAAHRCSPIRTAASRSFSTATTVRPFRCIASMTVLTLSSRWKRRLVCLKTGEVTLLRSLLHADLRIKKAVI